MRQLTGRIASVLYLGGSLIQGLAVAIIIPFARPLLGPVGWGQVGTALSSIQIGIVILSTGLPLSITRAYFRDAQGAEVARSIHGTMSIIGGAVAVVGVAGSLLPPSVMPPGARIGALILATLGLQVVVAGGLAMLRAMRAAHWFIAVSLLTALVPHLVGLALVTRYGPSAPVYLTGFVIAVGLAAVLVAVLVRPTFDRRHRADVVQAFKLGLPVVPHSLALMVLTQGAVSALFLISGARLAGEFYIIQVLATGSIQVVSALNNVWVTDIMDFADRSLQDVFTKTASKALLLGSALTLAASGMAPFVLWVLAPDSPGLSLPGAVLPAIAVAYVVYLQCNTLMFVQARTASLALVTPVVAVVSLAMVSAAALTSDLRWVAAEYTASFVLLGVTYFALLHSWHTVTWPRRELVIASASIVVAVASVGLTDRFWPAALRGVVLGLAAVGLLLVAVVSAPRPEERSTRTSTATR